MPIPSRFKNKKNEEKKEESGTSLTRGNEFHPFLRFLKNFSLRLHQSYDLK